MADYIIITDREQLKSLIRELIVEFFPQEKEQPKPDYLNVQGLLVLLAENGYATSKSQIYKYTSNKTIPFLKVGNKLMFSRSDIFEWIETYKHTPKRTRNTIKTVQAKMKNRL